MIIRHHIIYIFLSLITTQAGGQITTTLYGLEDGLPSTETYFGYQDDSNYLWFTTDRGVVRFDGYDFRTYTTSDGLAELVNFRIVKDPQGGFLVLGKNSSISFYRNGKFTHYEHNDSLRKIQNDLELRLDICDISKDKILFNFVFTYDYKEEYYELNRKTGSVRKLKFWHLKDDSWQNIAHIVEDSMIRNSNSEVFISKIHNNKHYNEYLAKKDRQNIFFTMSDEKVQKSIIPYTCNYSYTDSKGRFWMSDQGQLFMGDKQNLDARKLILNEEISSVIEDSEGNIWAFSPNNGIYKIHVNNFLKTYDIRYFNERTVDLYVNPPYLKFYTSLSWNFYKFYLDSNHLYSYANNKKYSLENNKIVDSIELDSSFNFSSIDKLYGKIDTLTKSVIINIDTLAHYLFYERIGILYYLNQSTEILERLDLNYVYDYIKLGRHILVAGSDDGLKKILYDPGKDRFDIQRIEGMEYRVNDLDKGEGGKIWTATLQGGIFTYDGERIRKVVNEIHPFTSVNSLEVLDSIAFIGTSTGLLRVNYKDINDSIVITNSQILGTSEGLSPPYVKTIEYYDGFIYVGTLQGLYFFHPDSFQLGKSQPVIKLAGVYQNHEIVHPDSSNHYAFSSTENFMTIHYTGISHSRNPLIPFYRYAISSSDSIEWVYTNSRELNLIDLKPGDYQFTVQCRNNANIWSEPAMIQFSIALPFTQTWTFFLSSIFLSGGIIWIIFYFHNRQIKKQQRLKNEILSIKMQSIRSQMNPHFVFNGMNAIQSFIFSDEKVEANKYITTFSSLLRDSLQMANRDFIPLHQEIWFMKRYLRLEKERFPDKFDYEIKVTSEVPRENIMVPTLMVQTLAENAVKHAFKGTESKGQLTIEYKYANKSQILTILVIDNGIGIKNLLPNRDIRVSKDSFGIVLLKRRIEIFNENSNRKEKASLEINWLDPENQKGTIITLKIPLNGNQN